MSKHQTGWETSAIYISIYLKTLLDSGLVEVGGMLCLGKPKENQCYECIFQRTYLEFTKASRPYTEDKNKWFLRTKHGQ